MSTAEFYDSGFEELGQLLKEFEKNTEDVLEILEEGAKLLVADVRKLPRPRSSMTGSGYTHLLDTISYRRAKGEVEAGWGKYYGPMVERGTRKMAGVAHFGPTFEQNKEKYYKAMTNKIYRGGT